MTIELEPQQLTLAPAAIEKIRSILADEPEGMMLRVFVQGGGCSGFQHGFTLDETVNEDDFVIEADGIKVLLDAMSAPYLQGTTIDYKEELAGAQFTLNNPNSVGKCGCGSSFSVG